MKKIFNTFFIILMGVAGISWEDHPDNKDFREADRHFKDMQDKTGASRYDRATVIPENDRHNGDRSRDGSGQNEGTYGPPDRDK